MISYRVSPAIDNLALNKLFMAAWPQHEWKDFAPILGRSLAFVCADSADELIGFVNLAWEGGIHAFLLDTTVHPAWRRRGIGRQLVVRAAAIARERGIHWLHVDYEPHLEPFYDSCGFRKTHAGLLWLRSDMQR